MNRSVSAIKSNQSQRNRNSTQEFGSAPAIVKISALRPEPIVSFDPVPGLRLHPETWQLEDFRCEWPSGRCYFDDQRFHEVLLSMTAERTRSKEYVGDESFGTLVSENIRGLDRSDTQKLFRIAVSRPLDQATGMKEMNRWSVVCERAAKAQYVSDGTFAEIKEWLSLYCGHDDSSETYPLAIGLYERHSEPSLAPYCQIVAVYPTDCTRTRASSQEI